MKEIIMSQPLLDVPFTKTLHKTAYQAISASQPLLSARGKTILITGGSAGIGLAIVDSFAVAEAAKIIIIARSAEALAEAKNRIETSHPSTSVFTFPAPITDLEKIDSIFVQIRARIAEPDILILNAAVNNYPAPTLSIPADQVWRDFETNVTANLNLVKNYLAAETLIKAKKILNVSSAGAHTLFPMMASYGASKEAFVHFLMHIQADYADKGVRITSFHPGVIFTNMVKSAGFTEDSPLNYDDGRL